MKCDKLLAFIYNETQDMIAQNYPKSAISEIVNAYYNGDNQICLKCGKFEECNSVKEMMK